MTRWQSSRIWWFKNTPEIMWWLWTILLTANIVLCGLGLYICLLAMISGLPFILLGTAMSWWCYRHIKMWDNYISNERLRSKLEELYEETIKRGPRKPR